jgi:2-methylcitrate dehydratase PrpD
LACAVGFPILASADLLRDAYHPASPTISPAFALAEAHGLSRDSLLIAMTAGYEVSTRIGSAVQPSHCKYFHTTGTAGVFGSTAACAARLKLDGAKAAHAMALIQISTSGESPLKTKAVVAIRFQPSTAQQHY